MGAYAPNANSNPRQLLCLKAAESKGKGKAIVLRVAQGQAHQNPRASSTTQILARTAAKTSPSSGDREIEGPSK